MTNEEFFDWVDQEGGLEDLLIWHGIDVNQIEDEELKYWVEEYIANFNTFMRHIIDKLGKLSEAAGH